MRILLVDSDLAFSAYVVERLRGQGIECEAVTSAQLATDIVQSSRRIDLILVDIDLPDQDGREWLAEMRTAGIETAAIIVSGRDSVEDKVQGLRAGADDFVAKPFDFAELLARIETVLRRGCSLAPIVVGDLQFDLTRRQARRNDHTLDLSPREFDLLLGLARASGRVFSRTELLHRVWDVDFDPGTNVVDVHIGRLRRKLGKFGPPMIETVRGQGYRLAGTASGLAGTVNGVAVARADVAGVSGPGPAEIARQ